MLYFSSWAEVCRGEREKIGSKVQLVTLLERKERMAKRPKYPYPIPELIEQLEAMQAAEQSDEQAFGDLARLLKICHATMQNAHAIWQGCRFTGENPYTPTWDALNYGLKRLVPLIIEGTASGWHELLTYIEHPEKYPWYDPEHDWPQVPPLEIRPEEIEEMCEDDEHSSDKDKRLSPSS